IRKGLMRVAVNPLAASVTPRDELIAAVVQASHRLISKRWGALIVFERETGLKHLDESGVLLHSRADAELMLTLFSPSTPLHDGAIVIGLNEDYQPEIRSARVLLPLAKSKNVDGNLGTRHRAAIGLTEENDALVLVVSEERGDIHLVENGEMGEALDAKTLKITLKKKLFSMKTNGKNKA
ncbi:MAG: DNA integrity scanning protein DisA nucleotide-binding domain protein, partial [Ghiorsea sp.]|nr:DNA integrity scanning protein DisA nucleotide-binding domain protein [Ghiorsea sp.]